MKLIRMLQRAHAIEIGAYHAYEGHWRSLPDGSTEQTLVKRIQQDEVEHRDELIEMLTELEARPNFFYDSLLWLIGKSISLACHVMGYKAAMWGAKIMEIGGAIVYKSLAQEARDEGYPHFGVTLDYMQKSEERHEAILDVLFHRRTKEVYGERAS